PNGGGVQVILRRLDAHLEIEVSDTGKGITPEFLPHVFERFRRAKPLTARHYVGLGMGVALVTQLTEPHGGEFRPAIAGEGKGAKFTVKLPASSALHRAGHFREWENVKDPLFPV